MIDFTNCKKIKKSYGGANGNKISIIYENERYMLKFPSKLTNNTELSYANGCVSEYLCCHIFQMLGIPVQETVLGTYTVKDKKKLVVACKDFVEPGFLLQDFASLKNQIIDSEQNGYGTELSSILESIMEQEVMDSRDLLERFWKMFVVDAFLGNFDRHNGNWGLLYNQKEDTIALAPVYDCGSCLYPQADKETIIKIINNVGERNTRIYNYPTSAIKENGRKISYYDYLSTTENKDCIEAVLDIIPCIDLEKINTFIDGMNEIPDLQKTFYKTMLENRYAKILLPAYEHAQSYWREKEGPEAEVLERE